MKEISRSELIDTCNAQFAGEPDVKPRHWAFVCPMCKTVQSPESLLRAGVPNDDVDLVLAYSCIGRFTDAGEHKPKAKPGRGCNWTLGGFLTIHKLVVVNGDERRRCFEPATPAQARALRDLHLNDSKAITSRYSKP